MEVTQINAQDIKTHQRSSQFYTILKQILKEAQGIGSLQWWTQMAPTYIKWSKYDSGHIQTFPLKHSGITRISSHLK